METKTFRLKTGQAYTFTATRPCQITFSRNGASRFVVTANFTVPGLKIEDPAETEATPETESVPKGKGKGKS